MIRSRAFTLLELLMATALMAILMLGVLAVVAPANGMIEAGKGASAPGSASDSQSIEAWVRLLAEDLSQARTVDLSRPNELSLMGYSALDDAGREQTHHPVRVLYQFQEVAGRRWLSRRQTALDMLTNQNIQRDLVGTGVTRFELIGIEIPARQPRDEARAAWKLMVWTGNSAVPAISRVIAVQYLSDPTPVPSGAGKASGGNLSP